MKLLHKTFLMNRRLFLKQTTLATAASVSALNLFAGNNSTENKQASEKFNPLNINPVLISTWDFGMDKHMPGWRVLSGSGRALDAVEHAVRAVESDRKITSVGISGMPDRDGHVTLDACIMDENHNCGSVMFLEHIEHPVSVARAVMEKTQHVYLAGDGALQFALENGFRKMNTSLNDDQQKAWKDFQEKNSYTPKANSNHDTVGMLALDMEGNLSGACSTSGWAFKMRGRVGDSPIIGSGLYVDNEVGAATATGLGENIIKISGSHLFVELMRNGKSPYEACKQTVERMYKKIKSTEEYNASFIAVDKKGNVGAYSLRKGFQYTITVNGETKVVDSEYLIHD